MLTHSPISGDSGTSGPQAAPGPLGQSESPGAWPGGAGFSGHFGEQTLPGPLGPPPPSQLAKHPGHPASWPGPRAHPVISGGCGRPEGGQGRLGAPRAEGAASAPPTPFPACSASGREGQGRERPGLQCGPLPQCARLTPHSWLGRPSPAWQHIWGNGPPPRSHEAICRLRSLQRARPTAPLQAAPSPEAHHWPEAWQGRLGGTPRATRSLIPSPVSSLTVEGTVPCCLGNPFCLGACVGLSIPAGPTPTSAFRVSGEWLPGVAGG